MYYGYGITYNTLPITACNCTVVYNSYSLAVSFPIAMFCVSSEVTYLPQRDLGGTGVK